MEYTKERIEQLPAGRELDRLVAVQVVGFKWYCYQVGFSGDDMVRVLVAPEHHDIYQRDSDFDEWTFEEYGDMRISPGSPHASYVPAYSTEIAASWDIVEALEKTHSLILDLHAEYKRTPNGPMKREGWIARFRPLYQWGGALGGPYETAPLAICRAALLAVLKGGADAD